MKRQFASFDYILFIAVCILSILGIVLIHSATRNNPAEQKTALFQVIFFIAGIIIMLAISFIDYHYISRFYIFIYVFCVLFLTFSLVYNFALGNTIARWIKIGNYSLQPSEFAKIFVIIFLATFIDKHNDSINNIFVLLATLILIAIPVVLIVIQPSLSASLVPLFISLSILFFSNLSYKYILSAICIGGPIISAIIWDCNNILAFEADVFKDKVAGGAVFVDKLFTNYQLTRITTMLDPTPDEGSIYQITNSIMAIGSGQVSGNGYNGGVIVQNGRLPEAANDFIFAVLGEQFGFVGCTIVLVLMLVIIVKCIIIAQKSPDFLGKLIAIGVASMFAFQTFVNVSVSTGIMPNTGMAFPFLSSGGSSLWISMASVGLVINVGMTKSKSIFEG